MRRFPFAAVSLIRRRLANVGAYSALVAILVASLPMNAAQAQELANAEYPAHTLAELPLLVAQHPAGFKLTIALPIAKVAFGKKGKGYGHVFLDSMEDYRDPRSVNINVFPHAARRLKLSESVDLAGRTVTVHAVARRVRIRCHGGCPQDAGANHYFQTQVFVRDGDDAQIEDDTDD